MRLGRRCENYHFASQLNWLDYTGTFSKPIKFRFSTNFRYHAEVFIQEQINSYNFLLMYSHATTDRADMRYLEGIYVPEIEPEKEYFRLSGDFDPIPIHRSWTAISSLQRFVCDSVGPKL